MLFVSTAESTRLGERVHASSGRGDKTITAIYRTDMEYPNRRESNAEAVLVVLNVVVILMS